MNLRKVLDDYVECNNFEIRYINNKITVFYYDTIENFTSNIIEIKKDNKIIKIKGKNIVIETMFEEYLIINGDISLIELC